MLHSFLPWWLLSLITAQGNNSIALLSARESSLSPSQALVLPNLVVCFSIVMIMIDMSFPICSTIDTL